MSSEKEGDLERGSGDPLLAPPPGRQEGYAESARVAEDLARRAASADEQQILEKIAALWRRLAANAKRDGGNGGAQS